MIGQNERGARRALLSARPFAGRRSPRSTLPEDARDLIARAEKLVYLFPEGFDADRLVHDQTSGEVRRVFDYDSLAEAEDRLPMIRTFVGRAGPDRFAVEVRPRSATIVADSFGVRRDLLLVLKEYAERLRREAQSVNVGRPV